MKREHVKELNDLREKLDIPPILFRIIIAYSIVLTKSYNLDKSEQETFDLSMETLKRVDIELAKKEEKRDYFMRKYGKSLVQQTMEELGIKDPRIEYLEEIKKI